LSKLDDFDECKPNRKSAIKFSEFDVASYAQAVVELFVYPDSKKIMSENLKALQPLYTVEIMAENFHSAIMGRL
jgi:hypothetical protein